MKNLFFLLLLTLLYGQMPVYGQLQPKTLFTTGDWAFTSDLDRYSLQDYNARAGILMDENLTLGGLVQRAYYNRFNDAGPDISLQRFGLFTRYFFKDTGQKMAPFLSGEVFFGSRVSNSDIDDLDFSRGLWGWRLGAGAAWFLSPSAAIEGQAGVEYFDEERIDAQTRILADIRLFFYLPPEGESLGQATPPMSAGMLLIGGQGAFNWRVSGGETGSGPVIALNPIVGYQFHPRWMVGGEFRFTSGEQPSGAGVTFNDSDLSVGLYPFLRLYVNPDDKFKVFAEGMAGAAFHRNSFNNEYPFRLRGSAGLDFFLSSNMALEAFLGYQGVKELKVGLDWEDGMVGGLGLRAFVGDK